VSSLNIDPISRFIQLVETFKLDPKTLNEWGQLIHLSDDQVRGVVKNSDLKTSKHSMIYTEKNLEECSKLILNILERFHEKNPLRKAMGSDILKQETGLNEKWLTELLEILETDGSVRIAGSGVALATHKVELEGGRAELSGKMESIMMSNGFTPTTTAELSGKLNESEKNVLEILHVLKGKNKVDEIVNGLWMYGVNMVKLRQVLNDHFINQDNLKVPDFKTMTGLTRKFAIPILEYCDTQGWTVRDENVRLKGEKL